MSNSSRKVLSYSMNWFMGLKRVTAVKFAKNNLQKNILSEATNWFMKAINLTVVTFVISNTHKGAVSHNIKINITQNKQIDENSSQQRNQQLNT